MLMMGSFTVPSVFGPEFHFTAYCIAVTECLSKFSSSDTWPGYIRSQILLIIVKGSTLQYLWFVVLGRIKLHPKLKQPFTLLLYYFEKVKIWIMLNPSSVDGINFSNKMKTTEHVLPLTSAWNDVYAPLQRLNMAWWMKVDYAVM